MANPAGKDEDCACEVEEFTVTTGPVQVRVDPASGLTDVFKEAWFHAKFRQNGCPNCCEFRQYVRGMVLLNGVVAVSAVAGLNPVTWHEDVDYGGMHYGHRSEPPESVNRYLPNQATGSVYTGYDAPGLYKLRPGDHYDLLVEFADFILDTCHEQGVVAGPERWDARLQGVA
jgi:hypothetical protein